MRALVEPRQDVLALVVEATRLGEEERREIMMHLRECLAEPQGRRWRRIYAALELHSAVLMEELLKDGAPELVVETAEGRYFDLVQRLSLLEKFECTNDLRVQNMVRTKATGLRSEVVPRLETAGDAHASHASHKPATSSHVEAGSTGGSGGSTGGSTAIWDLEEHTKVDDFHHGAELNAAAVSFDGALFATAGSDRQVAIWQRDASRDSGSPHATLTGHRGQVYSISFCPVTPTLFSASGDATARLWSLSSGQELMSLNWHTRDVNTVAPAPDGHVLATGSDDYCFALWDRRTGERIRSWDGRRGEGHSGRVYSVAFAPDGHSIATGAVDKKAKVWDTRTGACLQAFTSDEKALELLPARCRTLAVGEGDFAFSEALATSRACRARGLVVTCLEAEAECIEQYAGVQQRLQQLKELGVQVICGVDATQLGAGPLKGTEAFERIVFNFPLLPMKVHKPRASNNDVQIANRAMLVEFLRSAASFLRPVLDGEVTSRLVTAPAKWAIRSSPFSW
eukprot:g33266.t2